MSELPLVRLFLQLLWTSSKLFRPADEYRKTIGKDAALERRFQPVSIDEPTVEATISILRGAFNSLVLLASLNPIRPRS